MNIAKHSRIRPRPRFQLVGKASRSHKKVKKARKPRTIKNAIVNIDDVFIDRGVQNVNWLSIAKQKLTDRELRLLHKRQQIMDRIIMAAVHQFIQRNKNTFNFKICVDVYEREIRQKLISSQSAVMSLYAQSIANTLQKWKGYKTEAEVHSFRDYFQRCRRWFDSKKIAMMATHFWIPSMQLIHEFAMKAAARLFNNQEGALQKSFCDYLNVLILKSVFEGEMKPANARHMWLVPAMSYRIFLKRYNHTLHLVPQRHSNSRKHKDIRRDYVQCIHARHDHLREEFHRTMNQYLSPPPLPMNLPSISRVQFQNIINDCTNNSPPQPPGTVSPLWSFKQEAFQTGLPIPFSSNTNHTYANPMSDNERRVPSYPVHVNPIQGGSTVQPTYATNAYFGPLRADEPPSVSPTRSTQQVYASNAPFEPPHIGGLTMEPLGDYLPNIDPFDRVAEDSNASVPEWSPHSAAWCPCCNCCCCRSFYN